jgi:hypothetical protein
MSLNSFTEIENESTLEQMRFRIDRMTKIQHIEILRILKTDPTIKLNENKSGVYINMSFLSQYSLNEIQKYMKYIDGQENVLNPIEVQKETYKSCFFNEKEDKEEIVLYNSISAVK